MTQTVTEPIGSPDLPLIRISLVKPIVEEVERRGVSIHSLLDNLSLSRDAISSSELFVPAPVMYSLLEGLAEAAEDPYLTVAIGESLDLTKWPVFTEAIIDDGSVGDFFNRFTMATRRHATSVIWELKTDGAHARFKSRRNFTPNIIPAQADAFYVGLIYNIFRHAVGLDWKPQQVTVTVCDLRAVPKRYQGMQLQEGDKSGPSIRFPTSWLLLPFLKQIPEAATDDYFSPPHDLIHAIRESLKPYLHMPNLSVEKAAEICGFNERVLRRKLHDVGTRLSREIALLREQKAVQLLLGTDKNIADIGNAVGFTDQASFTRSFKRWTGTPPKKYRQVHSAGSKSRTA